MHLGPWRTEDFESLSWHDVHVHGFRFASFSEEEGSTELVLDIDFILKWEDSAPDIQFTICPAELTFHGVFGLKFEIDYAATSAGMCPFSIEGIQREPLESPNGFKLFRWRLPINWPRGLVEFEAPAFTQTLVGKPIVKTGSQSLSPAERASAA